MSVQKIRGLRYIKNAKLRSFQIMKNIVEFNKYMVGKISICGYDKIQLKEMYADLNDCRERLSRLQRKYL